MIAKPDQYDALREAGHKMAHLMREVVAVAKDGVSSWDLEERARTVTTELGARASYLGYSEGKMKKYPAALCVSVNNEIAHCPPRQDKVLRAGDVVSIDFGLEYRGLYMDAATTLVVGQGDKAAYNLLAGTKEALERAIAAARAGGRVGDISEAVEKAAKEYKLGVVKDLRGHGVGGAVHEAPSVPNYGRAGEGESLVEGLVVAIEPIFAEKSGAMVDDTDGYGLLTKDGSRAAHFEHTILITKEGVEVLTA